MKLSKQWSLGNMPKMRWRSLKQSQQSKASHVQLQSPHELQIGDSSHEPAEKSAK